MARRQKEENIQLVPLSKPLPQMQSISPIIEFKRVGAPELSRPVLQMIE
jgi:hypothetical protein